MVEHSKNRRTKKGSTYDSSGVERLMIEILRQAIYDWENPESRKEVKDFLTSEWAEELAAFHGAHSGEALRRLETEEIGDPHDFYAGAGPSLDRYLSTKNSRLADPLLLESLFNPRIKGGQLL